MSVRAERVRQAVALRAEGLTPLEVADRLGVCRSYVYELYHDPEGEKVRARKRSYSRPCPDCGKPMDGGSGRGPNAPKRCLDCTAIAAHENCYWTRERVVAAIQRWAETRGEQPRSNDWLYMNREQRTDPDGFEYPHVHVVQRECGSWANAIEQAGFPRPHVGDKRVKTIFSEGGRKVTNYVILAEEEPGLWRKVAETEPKHTQVEALNSAIGKAGTNGGGRFIAIPVRYFQVREAKPVTSYVWS